MKKYTIGLIAGALLGISAMMFMSEEEAVVPEIGRYTYHYFPSTNKTLIFDTSTGWGLSAIEDGVFDGIESRKTIQYILEANENRRK